MNPDDGPRTPRLDHENLDAYQRALDLLRIAVRIVARLPRGEGELREQLRTAAVSVPVNIAEGAGKPTAADRARFHAIARGSAMECAAWLDVCAIAGLADAQDIEQGVVAMLSKMCR